jgi:hypothetical protein
VSLSVCLSVCLSVYASVSFSVRMCVCPATPSVLPGTAAAPPPTLMQRAWAWSKAVETTEARYAVKVALGMTLLAIPVYTTTGAQNLRLTWAVVTVLCECESETEREA